MTLPLPYGIPDDTAQSERAWLAGLRAGDERVFEAVFHAHATGLARVAYRYVRSAAVAEELTQDVLFRVWERRATLDVQTSLAAYLHAALRNCALDYLKAERSNARTERVDDGDRPNGFGQPALVPSEEFERRELAAAVRRAIDALPARCRQAFALRWDAHLSYAEIAEVMRVSVKAVERQRWRALELLRRALAECWP